MELVGFLVLVGIIAAVVVVGFLTGYIRIASPGRPTRRPAESASLEVSPSCVCPKPDCVLVVAFDTVTDSPGATGELTVLTPSGNEVVLASQLSGRLQLPGDDPFFADGPGQYVFTFVASGLRRSTITQTADATLMPAAGFGLPYTSNVRMRANAPVTERQAASDTLVLGTGDFGKGFRRFTFCDKMTALTELRYGGGGAPGRSNILGVSIFNIASGREVAQMQMAPGDRLPVSPPITMTDGAAIVMTQSALVGGASPEANAYPAGTTVSWNVTAELNCN